MTDKPDQYDPEVTAIMSILSALTRLDDAARSRVLRWACDRYAVVA